MALKRRLSLIVFALCCLSIVSATISPACAFINGKSSTQNGWMEICSGVEMKIIPVNGQSDNRPTDPSHKSCDFCFQYFAVSGILSDLPVLTAFHSPRMFYYFINEAAIIAYHQSYQSRAPPVWFS